jgi:hypothetical protein
VIRGRLITDLLIFTVISWLQPLFDVLLQQSQSFSVVEACLSLIVRDIKMSVLLVLLQISRSLMNLWGQLVVRFLIRSFWSRSVLVKRRTARRDLN